MGSLVCVVATVSGFSTAPADRPSTALNMDRRVAVGQIATGAASLLVFPTLPLPMAQDPPPQRVVPREFTASGLLASNLPFPKVTLVPLQLRRMPSFSTTRVPSSIRRI